MSPRRTFASRDQDVSQFGAILGRLCDSVAAVAAALVDAEGESVDYAGGMTPFDIKVTAAEWQIVVDHIRNSAWPEWSEATEVLVRAKHKSFAVLRLPAGYSIALCMPHRAFQLSHRAASEAIREICEEAGLDVPAVHRKECWFRVDVRETPERRRPRSVWARDDWNDVDVLGRVDGGGLRRREQGYRVRFESGQETTLVRERLGRWYSDHVI